MIEKYTNDNFLKECIYDSLIILLEGKQFEKVSVSEICKKAGVSRMTYYRNFNSKEDILTEHLNKVFQKYKETLNNKMSSSTLTNIIPFFELLSSEKKLIDCLIRSDMEYWLFYQFTDYLKNLKEMHKVFNYDDPLESYYWINYYSAGLSKLLITWIKNGMIESKETMSKYLLDFQSTANSNDS